jgi:SAM-dependent methyltransferase
VANVPLPLDEAAAALAPLPVERAAELRLVTVDDRANAGTVTATVRLVPAGPLLIAYDVTPDMSRLADDVVMGVAPSSWALAHLTIRRAVETAVDIGTGCGIQAMLAARHAATVTATDTNRRALAFARFNAALNRRTNIELLEGDLFGPVADREFDLVVANPPYVISPDHDYLYRDGGHARDQLSREVVQGAAALLRPGGFAHGLVSWVHDPEDEWWEPLQEWVDGLGCDAWLLHFQSEEAEDYAVNWNRPLENHPEQHAAAVERWLDYFACEGIDAIGYGAVVLRRRPGRNWVRARSLGTTPLGPAGDQLWRLFAAADFLDHVGTLDRLLDERFVLDEDHRLEQVGRLGGGALHVEQALLHLERGLPMLAEVDAFAAHLLARVDGHRTLAEALDETADALAPGADRDELRRETLELVERLVELGFLHPVPR